MIGLYDNARVGWCISGDHSVASSRLQGFHLHNEFLRLGVDSEIVASNFNVEHDKYSLGLLALARQVLKRKYDLILFQRPNWMMYKLSTWCRLNGIRTVAIRCDNISGEYDLFFDATVVPTDRLKTLLNLPLGIVIEDMIEVPQNLFKRDYNSHPVPLKVVWVGHGSYRNFISDYLEQLAPMLENSGMAVDFVTISKGDWATHAWSLETVFHHILDCDVAIVPMPDDPQYEAKSANRLSMFMALGMPTIASTIPSYTAFAKHRKNCLLAASLHEFADGILTLRDMEQRENLGRNARDCAWSHFSPSAIATQWLHALDELRRAPRPKRKIFGVRDRALARALSL